MPLSPSRSRSELELCLGASRTAWFKTAVIRVIVEIAGELVRKWHFLALFGAPFVPLSPPGTDPKQGFLRGAVLEFLQHNHRFHQSLRRLMSPDHVPLPS